MFDLQQNTILLSIAGSRVYGTATNSSDVDVKGVAIPPSSYYLGFLNRFEQADKSTQLEPFTGLLNADELAASRAQKLEGSVYELRKFINLAIESNPNIWDVLFCRQEEVRLLSPEGQRLRENRELFISARARWSFSGYAHSQLKRILSHRQWLLNPPTKAPSRADFGLPECTLFPADQLSAAEAAIRLQMDNWLFNLEGVPETTVIQIQNQIAAHLSEIQTALGHNTQQEMLYEAAGRAIGLGKDVMHVLQQERKYNAAQGYWSQYNNWVRNRNSERAALEAKCGYDSKHASHLVRLLRMSREILTTGEVHVWRGPGGPNDAHELLAIRAGEWSFEHLINYANDIEAQLDTLYKSNKYAIPREPGRKQVDELCQELIASHWKAK